MGGKQGQLSKTRARTTTSALHFLRQCRLCARLSLSERAGHPVHARAAHLNRLLLVRSDFPERCCSLLRADEVFGNLEQGCAAYVSLRGAR
eukprot:6183549-Pleurochrysis_carterae.AAC.4